MTNLALLNNTQQGTRATITSVELCDLINHFRMEEDKDNYKPKQHNTLMRDIRNEVEALNRLGIGVYNFVQSSYINSQNKQQPCYELNRDGVLQMLNKESVYVRVKTIGYINVLEQALAKPKMDSYMINDPVERAKRWIEEYEEKRSLELLTQQQARTIEEQEVEIEHKEDVIVTLVEDVDLMTKRQRITQIVKYGSNGRISERWSLLYKEFETKYHIDVNRRMKRAKENGVFKKSGSKLEYICDIMGMTSQLFDVCVVVFEADYKEMLQYYLDVAQGK